MCGREEEGEEGRAGEGWCVCGGRRWGGVGWSGWGWWWWCGHDVTRRLKKWASASALASSAGLSSRQKPSACSLRRQVPGIPKAKPHPTPSRGKRLRGSPTSHTNSFGGRERNLFHLFGVGCPRSGILCKETPGRVFLVNQTLLTHITTSLSGKTRSNKLPVPTTITYPG